MGTPEAVQAGSAGGTLRDPLGTQRFSMEKEEGWDTLTGRQRDGDINTQNQMVYGEEGVEIKG